MLKNLYLFIFTSTLTGWSTPPSPISLSYDLQKLSETVLKQNLEIKNSNLSLEMKKQEEKQTGVLPSPTLRYSFFGESVESRVGPQEQKFSFEQKIPWPGKLKNQTKVARVRSTIAQSEIHNQKTIALLKIRLMWAEVQYLYFKKEKTLATLSLYQTWLNQMQVSYELSKTPYHSILKYQNQISQIQSDLKKIEYDIKLIHIRISSALNIEDDSLIEVKKSPLFYHLATSNGPLDINTAHHHNHSIMMANNDIDLWTSQAKLDKSDYFPDFSIGLSYIQTGEAHSQGTPESGKDPWSIDLAINIPIYFNQTQAKQKQSQFGKERANNSLKAAMNNFNSIKSELLRNISKAQEDQDLYETKILPNISQAITSQTQLLSSGNLNFLNLLESYQMKLEYELKVQSTIKGLFINKAKLLWLTGDTQPEFKLPFNTLAKSKPGSAL